MNDTRDEHDRFKIVILSLAAALRQLDIVDEPYLRVMWNGLDDVPIETLERSLPAALKRLGPFMPSPAIWRALIDSLPAPEPAFALLPPAERVAGVQKYCTVCDDAGAILFDRDGKRYARPCECRPRNPALGAGQPKKFAAARERRTW